MFTGIVEGMARVEAISTEGSNKTFVFSTRLDEEPFKIDQSVAHNGVCLTVVELNENTPDRKEYAVTAVRETLDKTNLGHLEPGDLVNLERCLKAGQRLDGHFVQGHVDTTGKVEAIEALEGSWFYEFSFPAEHASLLVDKGSICINGVSLTIVRTWENRFNVTIIPYTYAHTNFKQLKTGDAVNLEFDILGKYLLKQYAGTKMQSS